MSDADDIEQPTDDERELAETTLQAIESSDELGVIPFRDKETDERVLFLVAMRNTDGDDEPVGLHPIGPIKDFDDIEDRFEMPDELDV